MKNFLLFFTLVFSLSLGFCSEETEVERSEKIYVQPDQISISEKGIFLFFENAWYAVNTLQVDNIGIYGHISVAELFSWKCPHCPQVNPWWVNKCKSCGK